MVLIKLEDKIDVIAMPNQRARYDIRDNNGIQNKLYDKFYVFIVTPEDVEQEVEELLNEYNSKTNITLEDIVDFHFRFEKIHPFT